MLALGIDPGTAICGYGVVDMTGNRLRPVFYGSVLTDKDMQPELRLKKIYDDISDIIDHFHPDALAAAICGLNTASTRRWQEGR